MCGILGICAPAGASPSVDDATARRLRDRMTHRGPDDAGLLRRENVVLGHRRLAVLDRSRAGRQPMVSPCGRYALVYNGELYNDAEVRRELAGAGSCFASGCDSETVLLALAAWGEAALDRLRGMYAIGLVDFLEQRVLLARDPLGIKPLHVAWARCGGRAELVFASEIPPLLAHPGVRAEMDAIAGAAYLTTIRTTLLRRTLFAGVETLLAGERVWVDLRDADLRAERRVVEGVQRESAEDLEAEAVAGTIERSVRLHCRSDVPMCVLLSGGLDSSIVAACAREHVGPGLMSYCAGAAEAREAASGDFAHARAMASELGTRHVEVAVDAGLFVRRWRELVSQSGQPLSTPNEVAIHEVARALRAGGHVVTLSGEGADELFGGYGASLLLAEAFEREVKAGGEARALFAVESAAWVGREAKRGILCGAWRAAIGDEWALVDAYRAMLDASASPLRDEQEPLLRHLRIQRRVNLEGLLRRLDSATMLAGVEGRTPLADVEVARLADGLSVSRRFAGAGGEERTKAILREAFARRLPASIRRRPKASFPLPFEGWMGEAAAGLRRSAFAREHFTAQAIEQVAAEPARHWRFAWPMVNLAMWADRWL